jgi:hypothetical protein
MSAESKFTEAVSTFAHGNRYNRYTSVVRLGLIARNGDEAAVLDYIMTNAPTPSPNPAKVRSAIRFCRDNSLPDKPIARPRLGDQLLTPQERAERRRLLLPKSAREFVTVTLRDYWKTTAFTGHITADAFAETVRMSEADFLDVAGADVYRKTAALQLRTMFCPGEIIWAGIIANGRKTAFDSSPLASGGGIIEAHVLADRIESGDLATIPTHVSLNPVTGVAARPSGSFDNASTIAAYRHVLVEWDNLFDLDAERVKVPSCAHIAILAGLADYAFDHPDVLRPVCAVYTGGKSIHVVFRVKNCDTRTDYKLQTDALRDLFTSADDPTFRADPSGWDSGYTHVRLAGAIRPETGRRARLLFAK